MGKYDTAVKCAQIRSLIEENQYLAAMEEIEKIEFEKIPSISDLYLFADVFLKAEKLDVAKELYYTVYRRTASRPALYRLLMLVIRMGDIEEAKDLYLAYEIIAGVTLDTYELRYRLAKAGGEPRSRLIEILEQLKEDEYTEEWGLQLAKLYEIEGMREKCIGECDDLERWFGAGAIVDKARALRARCMDPSWVKPVDIEIPEPEVPDRQEEPAGFAHAPVKVEEISKSVAAEPESVMEDMTEEKIQLEPAKEPESVTEDMAEEKMQPEPAEEVEEQEEWSDSETAAAEPEEVLNEGVKTEEEDAYNEEQGAKTGLFHRIINYFKVDLESFGEEEEDFPEELDTYKQQSTAEINVKAILAEGVDDIMEEAAHTPERETLDVKPTSKLPVESLEEKLQEMEQHKQVINLEDTMNLEGLTKSHPLGSSAAGEIYEDVSRNGIRYCTLKGAIYKLRSEEGTVHFALTGGAEGISLAVAKKLFKELKRNQYFEAKNIGKIAADKLDEVDLDEWAEKFIGGCMYIMDAPSLSGQSVENLIDLMGRYGKQIVIILEGSYDEMDSFLNYNREFEKKITYKIKL